MIAKKCDRCGTLYEQYNVKNNPRNINGVMFLNLDECQKYFGHKPSDLCPQCSDELLKWWERHCGQKMEWRNNDN